MRQAKQPTKKKKRSSGKRIFAMILAGLLALLCIVPYVLQIVGYAESSAELLERLNQLQQNADTLTTQQTELRADIAATQTQAMDYAEQKTVIDQMLQVTQDRISNTQDQIQAYNLLIAARQEELDEARAQEQELYVRYQSRIRAIEEYGDISYWSVLFQAGSLSDMMDSLEMVKSIAESDQAMLAELEAAAQRIEAARTEVETAKAELETTRAELGQQEAILAQEQEQSDALLLAMTGDVAAMEQVSTYYAQQQTQLDNEIAETTEEYYIAVAMEEALAAAQAAVQEAQRAAANAETYADQAETYRTNANGYLAQAKSAATASKAQEAWDNAAWSAYLAEEQANQAQNMVWTVQYETQVAQEQAQTNPEAESCIAQAAAYETSAQAAADRAQTAADSASEIADQCEPYVTALKSKEATAKPAASTKKTETETETETETKTETTPTTTTTTGSSLSGFASPVPAGSSYVSSAYGNREHPIYGYYTFHNGVDLAANSGTPVYATKAGTIVAATSSSANGNYVTISHDGGVSSCYLHLSSYCVSAGDTVTQGQVIGYVGSTGNSTGPHLHFSILVDGVYVNPMEYVSVS